MPPERQVSSTLEGSDVDHVDVSLTGGANPFAWTSAAQSHPGRVRKVNEDACLEQPERGLWAVADGMGGHALGEFASRLAVHGLMALPERADSIERYAELARHNLQQANARLRAEAVRRDVPLIGTTIAVLLALDGRCACLWAGDSRVYLYRDGRLRQLTRDHSQRELSRALHASTGGDDTWVRPPPNLITRALGGADTLEIDSVVFDAADGDVFLLCSDGLSNEVGDALIEQALLPGDCRWACDTLVALALERGGHDNITAVVVSAEDLCSPDRTVILPVVAAAR
jgi:protein phosphatase